MRFLSLSSCICCLAVTAPQLNAAEWTKRSGLSVGGYYSTNICQVPEDEEGKAVGTFTPSVDVRADGARTQLSVQAAAEYNSLGESTLECPGRAGIDNRETWVPRVSATADHTVIPNALFLEADAFAAQNAINPFAPGADDNLNGTGNVNITYRWSVGGRFDRRHNENWASLIRYNYNEQYNSINRTLGDTSENRIDFDVGMIPSASRFSTGIRGRYSEVTFEETVTQPEFTNRLSRAEVRAAFQVNRQWQLNAFVGQEDNAFISVSDEIDGSFWDVGFRWTPNSRLTLDGGYGERFFGSTPRFSIDFRKKRHNLGASYARDLQFPRDIRGSGTVDPDDPLEPPVIPGDPISNGGEPTFLGQGPVVNDRFSAVYRFTARRTGFSLSASDSRQTLSLNGNNAKFQSLSARASRTLNSTLSANLGLSWSFNEGNLGANAVGQERTAWRFNAGLQRILANNAVASLQYVYTDQESDALVGFGLVSFVEHRVQLSISYRFGR